MSASVVTRSSWTDDPGTGLAGTILNNAELQKIYDNIDLMFSGTGSYTVAEFGGGLKVNGVFDLTGYKETATPLGNVSGGTVTFNLALGSVWTLKLTANAGTTSFSNVAASGRFQSFVIRVEGDGTARTWTWFDSTVQWPGDAPPTRTTTNGKFDWYMFTTLNGGSAWAGFTIGQNQDA